MLSKLFKKNENIVKPKNSHFFEIPSSMRFVDDQTHKETYEKDLEMICAYFGDLAEQNRFAGLKTLCHHQLVNKVGSDAINMLMNTSMKYWSEDTLPMIDGTWQRLLWRIVTVYPLGFAFENYSIRDNNPIGPNWNPLLISLPSYCPSGNIKIEPSQRVLSGANISQGIFLKLFPEYYTAKFSPMIMFAIMDVFSTNPNNDNPLFVALRNAIRKQIINDYFPIPYFWDEFIYHVISTSTEDILKYEEVKDHKSHLYEPMSVAPSQPIIVQHQPLEPITENELTSSDIPSNEISSYGESEIEHMIMELGELFSNALLEEEYYMNRVGAQMHRIEGSYYFVFPVAIHNLAAKYNKSKGRDLLTGESLVELLMSNNVIRVMNAQIVLDGRPNKDIQLAEINKGDHSKFVPIMLKPEDNLSIKIISSI